jgi:hypothetical protein
VTIWGIVMRKISEFLPFVIIIIHFATIMGALWPFIAQIGSVLYDADYLLIAVLNIIGTLFLNRAIHRRNDIIIPIIIILSIISTLLLIIAYFIVPDYNFGYFNPLLVEWLSNAESHPFSALFLGIIFCLTNILLYSFKFLARIKEETTVNAFVAPGILVASIFSLIIGAYGCLSAEFGWISHMPVSGFLIGLSTILLFNVYIRKSQNFDELLIEPQTIKNTAAKTYIATTMIRDFFIIFAALLGFLVTILMMAIMMSRRIAPVLFGTVFINSLPQSIVLIIIVSISIIMIISKDKKKAENEKNAEVSKKGVSSLQDARKKWSQAKVNPRMKATASKKGRLLLSRLPESQPIVIKAQLVYLMAPLLLIIPILTLTLEPLISWEITIFRHDSLYNLILGIMFALSFTPLVILTLHRLKGNKGSSFFVDFIWIGLPFVTSLILDLGFGSDSSEIGDFTQTVTIFLAVLVALVVIQLILLLVSTLIAKRRMRV